MPKYWKITNRALVDGVPSSGDQGPCTYWVSDAGPLDLPANWTKVSGHQFKILLLAAADAFPTTSHADNENQNHVTFFIHGYNNGWEDAARRYEKLCGDLFLGADGMGLCVSFDWPSRGSVLGYLPDRDHARACAGDLADVLSEVYDWLLKKQADVQKNLSSDQAVIEESCKAKVSVIAHSMGNYVTQRALSRVWTRKNQPLMVSLVNQLVMVAADVDNDLFEPNSSDGTDGNGVANLTYRVTSLFSGRDAVLGASAGLKHFGTRRLGRSGLTARTPAGKDNVWDIDCSHFFAASVAAFSIHSAYFETPEVVSLMGDVLCGVDRTVLENLGRTTSSNWLTSMAAPNPIPAG
ncbi:MAG TPA: alpha/beta fold hydrolase [Candidatus Limnocylindria bacterium]|nr:alpha/beta fold hydrolase [Candidatus Limnocylindria bacterium]